MRLIAGYVRPHARRFFWGVSVKMLGTVLELFIPYILAHIIDDVALRGDIRQVLLWGGVMLLCSALAWLMNIVANRSASAVARDSIERLRHDLFQRIMYLTNRQVDDFTIPSLISRMTTDTYNIHRFIGMVQRMGIRVPILLLGGLGLMLSLDAVMAGVMAAMMPVMTALVVLITRKSLPMFSAIQRAMDDLVRVVRENTTGIRVIKALGKEDAERTRFAGVNSRVAAAETRANVTMGLSRPVMNMLLNLGLVLVIIVGAHRINRGLAEVGTLVAFLSYFTTMLNAIMAVNRILLMSQNALASADRIDQVMRAKGELDPIDLPRQAGEYHLEVRDISFAYRGGQNTLEHISFALRRGESLGIIGPTGAGKSTLAALLLRFYDVKSGAIFLGDTDIRSLSPSDLRRRFGVVFQHDAIFKNTLAENVRVGRAIDMAEVERALEAAQAAAFVQDQGGPDYAVDAHGVNLSGGQRQRLLIARALAGRPEILILDDSSSALDYKTDAALRQSLHRHYGDTTTLIIAQRISSIRHCDRILVLEEGRALGYGTHQSLMADCALYREIHHIQMGED